MEVVAKTGSLFPTTGHRPVSDRVWIYDLLVQRRRRHRVQGIVRFTRTGSAARSLFLNPYSNATVFLSGTLIGINLVFYPKIPK